MPTLNQYAARIANVVNQPGNMDVLERAKNAIKNLYATRIRQSTERHGIDGLLKLSFMGLLSDMDYNTIYRHEHTIQNPPKLRGFANKIPVPMRIHNDAPFTSVRYSDGVELTYLGAGSNIQRFTSTLFPTGGLEGYQLINGYIIIIPAKSVGETINRKVRHEIIVEGIYENPEQVLSYYDDVDGQDIELPFPNDMMEEIVAQVLKVNFGVYPNEVSLKLNQGEVPAPGNNNT